MVGLIIFEGLVDMDILPTAAGFLRGTIAC